jgi:tRNA pseudouridine38-40 synthase
MAGELELWLNRLLGRSPIAVTGAGRTDAGVHAERMSAHFDTPGNVDVGALLVRLRAALPDDLAALALTPVPDNFHARYSALRKTYEYRLSVERSPFARDRVWQIPRPFEIGLAREAAKSILGEHDFSGFCLATSLRENNSCFVSQSGWDSIGAEFRYRVTANRFLHEMVRLLVGTMADIARGNRPIAAMGEILQRRDVS